MANALDTFAFPNLAAQGSLNPSVTVPQFFGGGSLQPLPNLPDLVSSVTGSSKPSQAGTTSILGVPIGNGALFKAITGYNDPFASGNPSGGSWLGTRGATVAIGLLLILGGLWSLANSGKTLAIVESGVHG